MNKYLSNKKLIGILIGVIVITAMIALSMNRNGNTNPVQRTVNDVTAFVGKVVTAPIHAVTNTFDAVSDLTSTYEENRHLKSQVNQMEELQSQLHAVKSENKKLEEELKLSHSLSDYEKIHASIITRNPDSWFEQIVVDKGHESGIEIGMPVMSENGLIGRVSEVGPTSAKISIMTTADQRENLVSAEIQLGDEKVAHGIIQGYDEESNRLIMDQITSNEEIQEGQNVVTSGLSDMTPRSLKIGTIDEVAVGDFGLTQRVYITPTTDFNDIRYVTIIKRSAESES